MLTIHVLLLCVEIMLQLDGATYKVKSILCGGGVGRNIAEGLYKLHGDVHLISAIGDDESGNTLNSCLPSSATTGVIRDSENATSICTVIFDNVGDCKLVLGDMKIHGSITPKVVIRNEEAIANAPLVVMDANLNVSTMETVLDIARKYNKPVFFEPTDMRIADKPFTLPRQLTNQIKFISPNIFELNKIAQSLNCTNSEPIHLTDSTNVETTLKIAKHLAESVTDYFDCIVVTLGALGVLIVSKGINDRSFNDEYQYTIERGPAKYRYYSAPKLIKLVNVSGAGDSFTSGFISAMLSGATEETCAAIGFKAARCALMAESAVPEQYFQEGEDKETWFDVKVIAKSY